MLDPFFLPIVKMGQEWSKAFQKTLGYMQGQHNRGHGAIALPHFFQICELGGLASHYVNLGTLACNTTHIYLDIKAPI